MRSPSLFRCVAAAAILAAPVPAAYPQETPEESYRLDLREYRAQFDGLKQAPEWAPAPCDGIRDLSTRIGNTKTILDREAQEDDERFYAELRRQEEDVQRRMRETNGNIAELHRIAALWMERVKIDLRERTARNPLGKLQGDYADLLHAVQQFHAQAC